MSETEAIALDARYTDNPVLRCDNGTDLYHEMRGDVGPVITIVNNFCLISPLWRNFTATLPEHNRVLTYDLRNQGASTGGFSDVTWTDHIDDLGALLDGLGIERTILLGTSVSCLMCRDFALAHPDRVEGLILVGPAFSPYGDRRRRAVTRTWINALENSGTDAMWDELYAHVFAEPFMEAAGAPLYLGLRELFTSLFAVEPLRTNLESSLQASGDPELLRGLRCPTLLVVGESDFVWTPSGVRHAESLAPAMRSVVIPGAGHLPYLEDPALFEQIVQDFVDECQPAAAHQNGGSR